MVIFFPLLEKKMFCRKNDEYTEIKHFIYNVYFFRADKVCILKSLLIIMTY